MRPIKLTMTAFGPYAKTEAVDFREAIKSGLFGIYGPTGSGKSTIFSAMTFALFGEAANNEQDTTSLRSDFADADTLTEVEFIFEVGNRRYLIRRRPDQMRPSLRGGGETKETHTAWFFEVTGLKVDDVTTKNCGKVIAEKKVSDVRKAILECLGYGPEQFKQIVLLPQGKFEKFLTAKTDERLRILRELFDVSLYRSLSQRLKDQAKDANDKVRFDRELCAARLKQEGYESPDALKSGITGVATQHAEAVEVRKGSEAVLMTATKALAVGEQLEEKFKAFEESQIGLNLLQEKVPARKRQEERLLNARKAQSLLDVDQVRREGRVRVEAAQKQLVSAQSTEETAAKAKNAAKATLNAETAKADICDELRRKIDALGRYQLTLKGAETLLSDWQGLKAQLAEAQAAFAATETAQKEVQAKRADAEARAKIAHTKSLERVKLNRAIADTKQKKKTAQRYAEAEQLLEQARVTFNEANQNQTLTQQSFEEAKQLFEDAERALAAAQAIHLSEKLEPGQPCSVCGSTEHPAPAEGTTESAGLDKAFRDTRARREELGKKNTQAAKVLSAAEALFTERKTNLERLSAPEDKLDSVEAHLQNLASQITDLGPEILPESINAEILGFDGKIKSGEDAVKKAREARESASTNTALSKQQYESALQSIPENLRTETALETAVSSANTELQNMVDALAVAEGEEKRTREASISAAKDVEAAEKTLKSTQTELESASTKFAERLKKENLSEAQFEEHKAMVGQIDALCAEIDAQKNALFIATDRLSIATDNIKDKTRPALTEFRDAKQSAKKEHELKSHEARQLKTKGDQLEVLLGSISKELARIKKVEEDTTALRELAGLFNAQNCAKLELETFAIGAMFDEVLQAANLRLGPMSNGRYSLEREIDSGKGAARRGLGIRVSDIYTGKTRPIQSLSGGETFIAALSLALGLSDVVESTMGNIRLDTIFIDEGFGTLDTENDTGTLDQVLQTLQDLVGDNRAVGLISHVPLVKQAIPNGFSIRKTPAGSHIEVRGF